MIEPKPRIVRCALCRHYMWSEHFRGWFCSLHHHVASKHSGCNWGEEKVDDVAGRV